MGIHLSDILSKNENEVYITSRKLHEDKSNIHYLLGNARDPLFIDKVLTEREWDSIVDFMVYGTEEFKNRLSVLLKSTKQYVFLSSARVYFNSESLLNEQSPRLLEKTTDKKYLNTDEYALYKAREENLLFESGYKNYTILRPYITFAENRLPLGVWEKETWLRRLLENKPIVLPRTFLNKSTSLAYGRDVSNFISRIVGNTSTAGQILNIVDNRSYLWSEILNIYLDEIEALTCQRPNVHIIESFSCSFKQILFNSILGILSFGLLNHKIKVQDDNYQLIYDREFNRKFDNRKLTNLIPEYQFSNIEDNLKRCLKEFSNKLNYNYRDWIWEAVQDKITGYKTKLSEIPTVPLRFRYFVIRYLTPIRYVIKK